MITSPCSADTEVYAGTDEVTPKSVFLYEYDRDTKTVQFKAINNSYLAQVNESFSSSRGPRKSMGIPAIQAALARFSMDDVHLATQTGQERLASSLSAQNPSVYPRASSLLGRVASCLGIEGKVAQHRVAQGYGDMRVGWGQHDVRLLLQSSRANFFTDHQTILLSLGLKP